MNNKILEFKEVGFAYERETVLKNVSFSLDAGDYLGIVGENGTGKTTLMKLILGFLPYGEGSIKIFGEERKTFRKNELLGYVSQKSNSFVSDFPATVYEVASAGLYPKCGFLKRPRRADKEAVLEALDMVGMAEFKDRLIGRLSGGQQQRVFIARELIKKPRLMVLDEPTVGIDARSVEALTEMIAELNRDGMTVIMTNHDTHSLKKQANKLLTLCHDGGAVLETAD